MLCASFLDRSYSYLNQRFEKIRSNFCTCLLWNDLLPIKFPSGLKYFFQTVRYKTFKIEWWDFTYVYILVNSWDIFHPQMWLVNMTDDMEVWPVNPHSGWHWQVASHYFQPWLKLIDNFEFPCSWLTRKVRMEDFCWRLKVLKAIVKS